MRLLAFLEKQNRSLNTVLCYSFIGLLGVADLLTGYELAFSLFYVLPISLITWLDSRKSGIIAAFVSAMVWLSADLISGHVYASALIPIWNTLIRLSFFLIIIYLLSSLREALEHEKVLAHIDNLTGAVNSRLFFELLQREIERCQRYDSPFTLAYMDLDNFKAVNDKFGHQTGDQVLRAVVGCSKKHLRKVDIVARIGGDEFAYLLPETAHESAEIALSKIRDKLIDEMRRNSWPVTFSMGVVTCCDSLATADELLRIADDLMYSVKRDGKDALKYTEFAG